MRRRFCRVLPVPRYRDDRSQAGSGWIPSTQRRAQARLEAAAATDVEWQRPPPTLQPPAEPSFVPRVPGERWPSATFCDRCALVGNGAWVNTHVVTPDRRLPLAGSVCEHIGQRGGRDHTGTQHLDLFERGRRDALLDTSDHVLAEPLPEKEQK